MFVQWSISLIYISSVSFPGMTGPNIYSPQVGHWQHTKETAPYKLSQEINGFVGVPYKDMGDSGSAGPPQHGGWLKKTTSPELPTHLRQLHPRFSSPWQLMHCSWDPDKGPGNCSAFLASWGLLAFRTDIPSSVNLPPGETVSIMNRLQMAFWTWPWALFIFRWESASTLVCHLHFKLKSIQWALGLSLVHRCIWVSRIVNEKYHNRCI